MEPNIKLLLTEFSNLPRFSDKRINYSNSNKALVLNCFVKFKGKILLLKRSNKVHAYKEMWNSIGGFIDEDKSLNKKVLEELEEEINISKENIKKIIYTKPYEFYDKDINKKWIICPVLVELYKKPKIILNWEHTESKWIKPEQLKDFNIVPKLDKVLNKLFY